VFSLTFGEKNIQMLKEMSWQKCGIHSSSFIMGMEHTVTWQIQIKKKKIRVKNVHL